MSKIKCFAALAAARVHSHCRCPGNLLLLLAGSTRAAAWLRGRRQGPGCALHRIATHSHRQWRRLSLRCSPTTLPSRANCLLLCFIWLRMTENERQHRVYKIIN